MTHPEQYGNQGGWRDPQGRYRGSGYRQDPYQPDPYQRGSRQGTYPPAQDPRQRTYPPARDPWQRTYPPTRDAPPSGEPEPSGGAEGNERLTVMTGAVLLILLAAEGFTILGIRSMLTLHFFLGMLLLGPVVLKAGSVSYRFFRYYTGSAPYRRKGPPAPLLRLLGPFVLLLTAGVFGSGVMLAVVGPAGRQPWLTIHKATFLLWFGAMAIHVLAYVPRLPGLLYAEARGAALPADGSRGHASGRPVSRAAQVLGGRRVRLSLLIASLAAGLVIAVLTTHLAGPWESQYFYHP